MGICITTQVNPTFKDRTSVANFGTGVVVGHVADLSTLKTTTEHALTAMHSDWPCFINFPKYDYCFMTSFLYNIKSKLSYYI